MPTSLSSTTASTPSASHEIRAAEDTASRPFLTFVLVTLLAALGGALFLAFQQTSLPDLSSFPPQGKGTTAAPPPVALPKSPDATATPTPR
jgi:hypothetical protein